MRQSGRSRSHLYVPLHRNRRWLAVVAVAGLITMGCSNGVPDDDADASVIDDAGQDANEIVFVDAETRQEPDATDGEFPPDGDARSTVTGDLSDLACSSGILGCADGDEFIDETCCAFGDPLVRLADGIGAEAVDIESDGTYAILCGGFGARVSDISRPESPRFLGQAARRCQHAAFGPVSEGSQVIYLSHHGDSWVAEPTLWTYRIDPSGTLVAVDEIVDRRVFFEGMSFHESHLYVAAHQGGLMIYRPEPNGRPRFLSSLSRLGNAWKVELDGDVAYVVDNDSGIRVVSVADVENPTLVAAVATNGAPRDAALEGDRLYVALGGNGVDVFDISTRTEPTLVHHLDTLGSAQSIAAENGVIAVAAWSHVALYDGESFALLATERTRQRTEFEQDLGVAMAGNVVHVAEWEGLHSFEYRQGFVGPDLWLDEAMFSFDVDMLDARAVVVRNMGLVSLNVSNIAFADASSLSVDRTTLTIPPGDVDVFEVTFTPPAAASSTLLEISSNDIDEATALIPVVTSDSAQINVGDQLSDVFGFLDPSGAGQLSALEGHVIVLSYFALF